MVRYCIPIMFAVLNFVTGCGHKIENVHNNSALNNTSNTNVEHENLSLKSFYSESRYLDILTDSIFNKLTDEQRIGQMIVCVAGRYGKTENEIVSLIKKGFVGGVLLLKGSKTEFQHLVKEYDEANGKGVPLIYSADAEPSLINVKMSGIDKFEPTNTIHSESQSSGVAGKICDILKEVGINQNYAPVCDLSYNREIIDDRSFGKDEKVVVNLAKEFVTTTQDHGIIATAKHFPGHGNTKGDSHKEIVYINGELKELNIFKKVIDAGVISVMVGHIAISNNGKYETGGVPSTLSRKIVTGLLKEEMGFKGIAITDAMNMEAVKNFQSPSLKAIEAGCDMVLMPSDEVKLINSVKSEMEDNPDFRKQVYESVRKILRAKIILNRDSTN